MAWIGADDLVPVELLRERNSAFLGSLVFDLIRQHVEARSPFDVTDDLVSDLNKTATLGLTTSAGNYRQDDVQILGSQHEPPSWRDVPRLMGDCCSYLNDKTKGSIHLSAYALWRLNWIHPFEDGNGRTARALCYLVFCTREYVIPSGSVSLPERIYDRRRAYHNLLEEADLAWRKNRKVALTNLEGFLGKLLSEELANL